MAYFHHQNEQNDPVDYLPEDQVPQDENWEGDEYLEDGAYLEDDQWEDDLEAEDREERRARRRDKMRVAAGVSDFFGVILGTVCILVLIALLVSLLNWLHADIAQNFALWQNKL